jgi:2-polyprenyl-6-methoxyphenol hydroxylase-like FAD-dependent oxidoreductase
VIDVLIIGGGVGGAALALALAQHPLRIVVVERRSGPGNVNRGDSLLPTVTRHLAAWGALDRALAAGAQRIDRMQVFDGSRLLLDAPLASRWPYLVLPHPEIERVLLEAAVATGRVEVRYRRRFVRLLGARVRGAVVEHDGVEEPLPARLVVGADGSASPVRAALGLRLPTRAYDHAFFIVDVERPSGYRDAMRVQLHADGGILAVPQASGRVGLGVLVRGRDEALFRAGALEEKLAAIARRAPLFAGCRAHPGAHLYALARGHAPRYLARGAAMIGDAAHVTNPTAGQGMTMAIEDAEALARHVAPLLVARLPPDVGLLAYARERRPRNGAQVRWSHWLSRLYALDAVALQRRVFAFGGSPVGQAIQQRLWRRLAA